MDFKKIYWNEMTLDYAAYAHERLSALMEAIKDFEGSDKSACLITNCDKLHPGEYLETEIDHAMAMLYKKHSECPFGYGYVPKWNAVYIYKLQDLEDLIGDES